MAKNKIQIDIEVNGKMQKATVSTKKLRDALDGVGKAQKEVGENARTTDRRVKGASQQSANATKNFSKMAQGISGGLVPAYATLAAQVFAVSAVFQFLKDASDVTNLVAGQEALAATTGVAYKTISNAIKEATDGQLSYVEASKAAAIGTAAGLSPTQLSDLGRAAKNASVVLGRDLVDSFNRLIRGVTKAEPELLDELGIILRLDPAVQKYKTALNITGRELSAFERTQAVTNEVLGQAEQKFGAIEAIMDPSAASLNRFLVSFEELINTIKKDLIELLRPTFDFLSSNTAGLVASLGLVALPIIKSIIPSFSDWAASAQDSIKKQNRVLKVYERNVANAKKRTEEFSKSMADKNKDAMETSKKLLGDQPKSKTGGSGADFLLGTSNSKKAQRNADKILNNAQAQIDQHGKIVTGKLAGYNQQQVNDLRQSYATRTQFLKGTEVQHKITFAKMKADLRLYGIQFRATMAGARAAVIGFAATAATAMAAVSAALGWIGLIGLAGSLLYELYRYLNPIAPEIAKAKQEMDDFTESTKSVNEEIERTAQLMQTNLLGVSETVVAAGNALNSANLVNSVIAFEELDSSVDPKKYAEAKVALEETFKIAEKIAPEISALADAFERSGTLTADQKRQLSGVVEEYVTASSSIQQLAAALQTLDEAMLAVGATVKVSPFASLGTAAAAAAALSDSAMGRMTEERDNKRATAATRAQLDPEDPNFLPLDEYSNTMKAIQKEYKAFTDQNKYLNTLADEYLAVQEDIFKNETLKSQAALDQARNQTAGLNIAQQIANLENERLGAVGRAADALNKQISAQAAFNAAKESGDQNRIDAAQLALDIATDELEILGYQLATEEEIRKRKIQQKEEEKLRVRQQGLDRILGYEKQIFDLNQKAMSAQLSGMRIRAKMLRSIVEAQTTSEISQNPFINQERALAQFKYDQALARLAEESNFIDRETAQKETILRNEYTLLAAKRDQLVLESKFQRKNMKDSGLFSEEDFKQFDTAVQALKDFDYDGQLQALLQNARLQGEEAKLALILGVYAAAQKLEAEQPFEKLFQSALDSFEKGIQDVFMLVFDSLTTEMDNFNDQLKEIGRGVIRSIQEELTQQFIVQPLMKGIDNFLDREDPNDPAAKIKAALELGGTDLAKKIKLALSGQPIPGESTDPTTLPKGNYLLGPDKDTTPKASTKIGDGTTKTTSEAPAEGVGNLTKSIDNLTIETGVSVAAMGTVIAGLTGNSKVAEKLAAVTAALKAYQVVSDGIKKISDFRRDLAMQANTAALTASTAAQTASGGGGGVFSAIAGFFGFGAKNGKMGMGYATGGIARGSQGGFPAVLHGTEAVVPLPDGRSIPVEMAGGGGQQNNVTVNVAVDNNGGATSSTGGISGDQAAKLGNAISEAVKKELLNQKRPGGMLSPYGVA